MPAVTDIATLEEAIGSRKRVGGLTHALYRYPARFTPEFARAAIEEFTERDEWVMDPFVGGGTSAVEALASGRRVAAIDLNPLAVLLTRAKTTPLYARDFSALNAWLDSTASPGVPSDRRLVNAPAEHVEALAPMAASVDSLTTSRQRDAARAILVHVGQWALDGRQAPLPADRLRNELGRTLERHAAAVGVLSSRAVELGIRPSALLTRRIVRQGHAAAVAAGRPWNRLTRRFRLVLTSPPYPSVHVLYHRWQVNGRAETALPYWLSNENDGLGESYYTMGGRAIGSEDVYFRTITESFAAIRRLLLPEAHVVQLVSFNAAERQLPRYLAAMDEAGYDAISGAADPVTRDVPNRRWYFRVAPARGDAREYLLVHRLRP